MPSPLQTFLRGTGDVLSYAKTPAALHRALGAAGGAGTGYALSDVDGEGNKPHALLSSIIGGVIGGTIGGKNMVNAVKKHPFAASVGAAAALPSMYAGTFGRESLPEHELPGGALGGAAGAGIGGLLGAGAGDLISDDPDAAGISPAERKERHSRALRNSLLLGLLGTGVGGGAGYMLGEHGGQGTLDAAKKLVGKAASTSLTNSSVRSQNWLIGPIK